MITEIIEQTIIDYSSNIVQEVIIQEETISELGQIGHGVASGGTTGQVLAKKTDTNYDTEWVTNSGGGGGSQTLAQTLDFGNETEGFNIKVNNADAIELENTSLLKKGTYNFGGNGGISRICSNNYEDMWQNGFRHVFDQSGFIRNSSNCFDIIPDSSFDVTLRFKIGSIWTLDDSTSYACTDATTGAAVWEIVSGGSTNLTYTASPTDGTVVSSSGTDATLPLVDVTNAGLVSPSMKTTWDGKQDALGFTPYNATNPSGYQTLAQVNAKISDELWGVGVEGLTNIASSQNAVFNGIANVYVYAEYLDDNKQPLAAVLSNTTASFTTADETKLDGIATSATANDTNANLKARANHTGTQTASTISDLNSASRAQTEAELLAGANITITPSGSGATRQLTIATSATANDTDANLKSRANHTGTQTASTISDLNSVSRAQTEAELLAGTNITITPSGTGASRQLTIASTGGTTPIGAFTMLANNTNASAVPTEKPFINISNEVYSGTIVWTGGAAPTVPTHTYSLSQVGNVVTLIVNLAYGTAGGSSLTSVAFELPSGAPVPLLPTSVTTAGDVIGYVTGYITPAKTQATTNAPFSVFRLKSTSPNVFEINIARTAAAYRYAYATIQYTTAL